MKIQLNTTSYMIIKREDDAVVLGIKTKQGKESYLITSVLQKEHLDKIITELISLRARLPHVEKES